MSATVTILGAGRIGHAMALDMLAMGHDVTVLDACDDSLEQLQSHHRRPASGPSAGALAVQRVDLSAPAAITDHVRAADLVLGALPSHLGLAALDAVIDAGRPYCDISFMAENPLTRHDRARQRSATVVVDCGVAPGLSNLLAGRACALLDRTDRIDILVGGLPKIRRAPFEYKAGFSPDDVLEEYTRPVHRRTHGRIEVCDALSEPEPVDFPETGTLEAFNTDGLRSLLHTLDVPTMTEKTLRYPGHAALMRTLRDIGLLSSETEPIGGVPIAPRRVLRHLLERHWRYEPGEADLTLLRVRAAGRDAEGLPVTHQWDLYDEYDPAADLSSMARTTAFACTAMAQTILDGTLTAPGVRAPEQLAADTAVHDAVIEHMRRRNITIRHNTTPMLEPPPG